VSGRICLEHCRYAIDGRGSDGRQLSLHSARIVRNLGCELGDLGPNDATNHQNNRKRQNDRKQNRWYATKMDTTKQVDQRREHKGKENRDGDWCKNLTRQIKGRDYGNANLKRQYRSKTGP
jgi:hypothetical protein